MLEVPSPGAYALRALAATQCRQSRPHASRKAGEGKNLSGSC
jgi:hypothetical protein